MQSADCILSPKQSADCAGSQIACNIYIYISIMISKILVFQFLLPYLVYNRLYLSHETNESTPSAGTERSDRRANVTPTPLYEQE